MYFCFADLLEGLKRAQRFRLEDQRGTEINFELPDFLKDSGGRHKLRKVKQLHEDGASILQSTSSSSIAAPLSFPPPNDADSQRKPTKTPQPAPRLSISRQSASPNILNNNNTNDKTAQNASDIDSHLAKSIRNSIVHEELYSNGNSIEHSTEESPQKYHNGNEPPPLPPKPKIKPSNWMNGNVTTTGSGTIATDPNRMPSPRTIYLDQPNSSFV